MFQENVNPPVTNVQETIRTVTTVITLIISVTNLIYAIYIFKFKDRKDDLNKEKDLKIGWFKSLVLDYNLQNFYDFFDNVENEVQKLKNNSLSQTDKEQVNNLILEHQIILRRKFIDTLLAVDETLYKETLSTTDKLVDNLTNAIFNPGIVLSHQPKFEEEILNPINQTRTEILKKFFSYRG